jgi:hypothetical protein
MIGKNNNIDDFIRGKVFDYSTPPPETVWENIEESLSENKKKKILFLSLKIAAGITFLAGMTALYIQLSNPNNKTINPIISETAIKSDKNNPAIINSNEQTTNKEIFAGKVKIKKYTIIEPSQSSSTTKSLSDVESIASIPPNTSENKEIFKNNEENINHLESIEPVVNQSQKIAEVKNEASLKNENLEKNPNDILFDDLMADNEADITKKMLWSVGGQAGPQYTYRKLMSEDQVAAANTNYDNYDSPLLAYAGGLQIEVEPAKRLTIQSGVYYSKVGQKISSRYVESGRNDYFESSKTSVNNKPVEVINSIGTLNLTEESDPNVSVSSPNSVAFDYASASNEKADLNGQQYFEFIEIPFILKYKIVDQKFDFKLIGGINTDIMVNNYAKITNGSNYTIKSSASNLNTFNYSGTVGLGFDVPLTDRLLFNLEPFFKYYLSPINSNSTTEAHPYMIGVMSGINYTF